MPRTDQTVSDDQVHPTDSFFGRQHRHKTSGRTAQIRLLGEFDLDNPLLHGRPGVDFFAFYNRDNVGILTPEQYGNYTVQPRQDAELAKIRLYDWLVSQDVPMISNTDLVTKWDALGVAVQVIWGASPPETAMVYLPVRALTSEQQLAQRVSELLGTLGITAAPQQDSGGWMLEFPARELAKVPA